MQQKAEKCRLSSKAGPPLFHENNSHAITMHEAEIKMKLSCPQSNNGQRCRCDSVLMRKESPKQGCYGLASIRMPACFKEQLPCRPRPE